MKAFLIKKRFLDGSVEGVVFTNIEDANQAFRADPNEDGSTLALAWAETYGDSDIESRIQVIDI